MYRIAPVDKDTVRAITGTLPAKQVIAMLSVLPADADVVIVESREEIFPDDAITRGYGLALVPEGGLTDEHYQ